jgi:hypothetical protein
VDRGEDRSTCVFLPGVIAPAVVRYGPLLAALGDAVDGRTKELEICTLTPPGDGYSIESEVEGQRALPRHSARSAPAGSRLARSSSTTGRSSTRAAA